MLPHPVCARYPAQIIERKTVHLSPFLRIGTDFAVCNWNPVRAMGCNTRLSAIIDVIRTCQGVYVSHRLFQVQFLINDQKLR